MSKMISVGLFKVESENILNSQKRYQSVISNSKRNDPFKQNLTQVEELLNLDVSINHFDKKRGSDPVHLPLLNKNMFNESVQQLIKDESIGAWEL